MQFASPIAWWLTALVTIGIAAVSYFSYARPFVPLSRVQRGTLTALRALALGLVVLFLCRPVWLSPPVASGDRVVPILVDVSRSMRVRDADGESRLERAIGVLRSNLLPALTPQGRVEVFGIGEGLTATTIEDLRANGRKSDLAGALAAARDRFRGQRVPGIVLLTDGAETGLAWTPDPRAAGLPVFAIGLGSADGLPDREILSVSAADAQLDQTTVDVHVLAASHGFGRAPFQLRLLADGKLVESRQVAPLADGSPLDEAFTVSPDPRRPNVYTAQIVSEPPDAIPENDARTALVSPTGRKRRVLILAGAPGYDHSFIMRALGEDPGLEIDSVVRKGKNDENADTFLVQAGGGRAAALTSGFPAKREALFAYDSVILANIEGDFFTRAQLTTMAEFVSERGGGLLVMGGRVFEQRGLMGTALEAVLPVELNDRRGLPPRQGSLDEAAPRNAVVVTAEGQTHPVMRIGASIQDTKKLWDTLPRLAAIAPLGGPRAGATVLAVGAAPSGELFPVVAVQRYGRGRSMVFGGEASWRWRMMEPATDRRYEFFWRQALRWLSTEAPDPVALTLAAGIEVGDSASVDLDVRDSAFVPVPEAQVEVSITPPNGAPASVAMRPGGSGRFTANHLADAQGLYHVHAEARRGTTSLGSADRWVYVGGSDREFAEPRLNEGVLQRLARESGGEYVRAADAGRLASLLADRQPPHLEPVRHDLWHEPWAFVLVLALVASEWILRRVWGLR